MMLQGATDRKLSLLQAAARCIADPRNPLYGQQEGRFFHGYYDCYCYLPLYAFCGQQLLCAYLRPSCIDDAKHAAAILKLLVTRLYQTWCDAAQMLAISRKWIERARCNHRIDRCFP